MTNLPDRPGSADRPGPRKRPDPRLRPPDPAGTRPRVDPGSLVPARIEPEIAAEPEPIVDAEVVEDDGDLLPERREEGGELASPVLEVPHAPRFQFILGALIAVAVVAVAAGTALIIGRPASNPGPAWSPWHPNGSGTGAAQEIADHVGPEYRLANGQQLVEVNGGPLEVAGFPMTVVLRSDPTANGNISVLNGNGVLYRLCGLGPNCSIDQGKPSTQRGLLVRREALELALYSFRYLSGVNEVVVFLPPPNANTQPSEALFFRPANVLPELNRPLYSTLVPHAPSVTDIASSPDSTTVQRLTDPTVYLFTLTQSNTDAGVFLVLRPPTAAGG